MCGISGIWSKQDKLNETELIRFNDTLMHRGPDGSGVRIFKDSLGLAHRRLSILDVSDAAAQPMSEPSGRYTITFNGEVFNFIELRRELISIGVTFSSDSDTEVVLSAYMHWGVDAFAKFNGMWAMAIWDSHEEVLMLCRDRFGIKPLYFLNDDKRFAFASETNAFKNLNAYERRVNQQHLDICMEDTYALEGRGHTIYEGIYQLLPGHFIRIKKNDAPVQKRWYDIRESKVEAPSSYSQQTDQFRSLFQDTCALRMRSDVSLATALSGGVDSTAVYSMVHRLMNEQGTERVPEDWQKAFVAIFPGTRQDETDFAKAAVAHTGGDATYLDPTHQDLPSEIESSTLKFDAISSTPLLALTTVYQGMRKHGVTVSLDGHGVDEMLYGYRSMVHKAFEYHNWHGTQPDAKQIAETLLELYPPDRRKARQLEFEANMLKAQSARSGVKARLKKALKLVRRPSLELKPSDVLPVRSDRAYDFSDMNPLDRMVYEEFFIDTLPSLFRNFDKASMLHGVEIRMPFMDYRLVEYCFALPYSAKMGGGFTKRILRDSMTGIMPESIRSRKFKVGLAAPTAEWFGGPLNEWINDTVKSQSFRQPVYWNDEISKTIIQHAESNNWNPATASRAWMYLNADIIVNG